MGEEEEAESPRDDDDGPSSRPGEGSGVGLARLKEAKRAEPECGGKRERKKVSEKRARRRQEMIEGAIKGTGSDKRPAASYSCCASLSIQCWFPTHLHPFVTAAERMTSSTCRRAIPPSSPRSCQSGGLHRCLLLIRVILCCLPLRSWTTLERWLNCRDGGRQKRGLDTLGRWICPRGTTCRILYRPKRKWNGTGSDGERAPRKGAQVGRKAARLASWGISELS